jgi:ribosomal protein L37AE/L43A
MMSVMNLKPRLCEKCHTPMQERMDKFGPEAWACPHCDRPAAVEAIEEEMRERKYLEMLKRDPKASVLEEYCRHVVDAKVVPEPDRPTKGMTIEADSDLGRLVQHLEASALSPEEEAVWAGTRALDPNGLPFHAPGAKGDAQKPRADLLLGFSRALLAVAEVSTYGASKYSENGWAHVPNGVERYTAAMLRHLLAEQVEERDEESGLAHAAQTCWNSLARLELMLRK